MGAVVLVTVCYILNYLIHHEIPWLLLVVNLLLELFKSTTINRYLYPDLLKHGCPLSKVTSSRFVIRQNRFYRLHPI